MSLKKRHGLIKKVFDKRYRTEHVLDKPCPYVHIFIVAYFIAMKVLFAYYFIDEFIFISEPYS